MRFVSTISVVFLAAQVSAQPLTTGLVAHFTFDGDAGDSGPFAYPTIVNGDPVFIPGMNAGALRFSGDDWIRVNHGGGLTFDLDDSAFSVACFVRFDDFSSEFTIYQNRHGSNDPTDYNLSMNASFPRLAQSAWFGSGTNYNYNAIAGIPLQKQWMHLVMTYEPGVGKMLYVNGQVVDTTGPAPAGFTPNTHGVLTIGAGWYPSSMQNHLRGDIDDLRIYNRALSGEDVQLLAGYQCAGDADRNSAVNFADITAVLANFNASCP